jgi:hypothetical protein
VPAQQHAEVFEAEPGDPQALLDGVVAEGFEQERLPGPRRSADHEVLAATDPFQGLQCLLGGGGDRRQGRVPGLEGLAGGESGRGAAGRQGGPCPAGDLLGEQDLEDFGGVPALGFRGGQDVGGVAAQMGQPEPAQQLLDLGGQRRRPRHA